MSCIKSVRSIRVKQQIGSACMSKYNGGTEKISQVSEVLARQNYHLAQRSLAFQYQYDILIFFKFNHSDLGKIDTKQLSLAVLLFHSSPVNHKGLPAHERMQTLCN